MSSIPVPTTRPDRSFKSVLALPGGYHARLVRNEEGLIDGHAVIEDRLGKPVAEIDFVPYFEHSDCGVSEIEGEVAPDIPITHIGEFVGWLAQLGGAFLEREQKRGAARNERFTG